MREIEPFKDPTQIKAVCEKCGWEFAHIKYCPGVFPDGYCGILDGYSYDKDNPEHIHRTCERCKFVWLEKCLSNKEDDPKFR